MNLARTEANFETLLIDVNKIYEQVGIKFKVKEYKYVVNKDWIRIDNTKKNHHIMQSTSKNTGGFEVYCIDKFMNIRINGINTTSNDAREGLTIVKKATSRTLAHELGHACGLDDIYDRYKKNGINYRMTNDLMRKVWNENDWSCDESKSGKSAGFYSPMLKQKDSIQRLLMYGYGSETKTDISLNTIYGLNTSSSKNDSISTETGLKNMKSDLTHY